MEQTVAAEMSSELAALPARCGFESADAFIAGVRSASGSKRGRAGTAPAPVAKRRKRTKITDVIRAPAEIATAVASPSKVSSL